MAALPPPAQIAPAPAPPDGDWLTTFQSFTLMHLIAVVVFGGTMVGAAWLGRRWNETPREARFRRGWGWLVLAFQAWATAWYLLPWNFQWHESLPLQLCDLAGFVAGLAMVTHWRPWRTLLYFWGIGLSTQAFITPTLLFGPGHIKFWMFWIGHTMIVGSAVYDIIVCGYRPRFRDFWIALSVTYALCMGVFYTDVLMTDLLKEPINYWYIGEGKPDRPTVIDRLGPWPLRVLIVIGIVVTDFVLLWAVWPIGRRLMGWKVRGVEAS